MTRADGVLPLEIAPDDDEVCRELSRLAHDPRNCDGDDDLAQDVIMSVLVRIRKSTAAEAAIVRDLEHYVAVAALHERGRRAHADTVRPCQFDDDGVEQVDRAAVDPAVAAIRAEEAHAIAVVIPLLAPTQAFVTTAVLDGCSLAEIAAARTGLTTPPPTGLHAASAALSRAGERIRSSLRIGRKK